MEFAPGVVVKGEVTFVNGGDGKKEVQAGEYENVKVEL